MVATSNAILCVLLCLVLGARGAQVTPMEKVITLLKSLSAKVTAEGANEAAQYDKYACFCKEQADEKNHAIEKSDDKIASLSAEINMLDTAVAELDSEISGLSRQISSIERDINRKTAKRNREHDEYLAQARDMNEAIDACGAAVDALKTSKSAMKGAKLSGNFAQVQKATNILLSTVAQQPLLTVAPATLTLLSDLNSAKGAPKFQYQSNDIIATIESLQATFKNMKMQLDTEEAGIKSAFVSARLGLSNEKKFADKHKSLKEAIVESKTEQVHNARNDRDSQAKDRNADLEFLGELTKDCEEKAVLFDQRSKMRGDEINVLAEATTELQNGALSESKKLVGLVQGKAKVQPKPVGIPAKVVVKKAPIRQVSFLQVRNNEQEETSRRHAAVDKVISLLTAAAARTGSTTLTSAAVRAKYAEDHFVKVRGLIKDLLAKLKADANSEATTKSFCDTGMAKGLSDRDEANARIEMANAKITTLTANQNTLEDDIATLRSDIAELKKGVLEGTEMQAEDQAALKRIENMSEDAIASVKLALSLLEKFYNKAFLQTQKYVPPGADREGNTLDGLAPKVFENKYHAAQTESKGITGILQVVMDDFQRIEDKTKRDEATVAAAWIALKDPLTGDIFLKEKEIEQKTAKVSDTKSDILDQQQALSDAQDLLESGQSTLEGLQAMCVKGQETWDERKKAREDEIEALKDAVGILEDWKGL